MDFHQYEAFYIVARERSFSRAAEILHVSQSAISTRINNLESKLGVNLFLRNGRSIELSIYGEYFEPYVRKSLQLVKEAESGLKVLKQEKSQHLRIGATSSMAISVLPKLLNEFQSVKVPAESKVDNIMQLQWCSNKKLLKLDSRFN